MSARHPIADQIMQLGSLVIERHVRAGELSIAEGIYAGACLGYALACGSTPSSAAPATVSPRPRPTSPSTTARHALVN